MANCTTTSTWRAKGEPDAWMVPPFSTVAGRKLDSTSAG